MTNPGSTPHQVLMVITYDVHPDDHDAFRRIAGNHAAASGTYPGCVRFSVSEDVLDPNRFHLVEQWADQEHLDAHFASPAFQATSAAIKEQIRVLGFQPDRFELVGVPGQP
jgi:quinol monooxygenase YgiN